MATQTLQSGYVEPTRPYSLNEIKNLRKNIYRELKLGNTQAEHPDCRHFYNVKKNGKKEKDIKEQKCKDVGNCSICWKLSKTPHSLRDNAKFLVLDYLDAFFKKPEKIGHYEIEVERCFYTWLYNDY